MRKLRFHYDGYPDVTWLYQVLGINPAAGRARRRRPGAAAGAYSLALNIVQDTDQAADIAVNALRKGAGSRTAVMAHARREAIARGGTARPDIARTTTEAATDLRELARQLAQTRPVLERVMVDLELRCSLDTGSFARVLGLTNARALERSREVTAAWAADLDPAMMAWLGPGSCDDLAVVLTQQEVWPRNANSPVVSSVDTTGPIPLLRTGTDGNVIQPMPTPAAQPRPITVEALLSAAPAVHEHAAQCDVCSERIRMLTPVRTLVGQVPMADVPGRVAEAAKTARRRLPAPLPASIEPRRLDVARLRVPALGAVALAGVFIILAFTISSSHGNGPSQAKRVAELVQAAPTSRLLGTPSIVTPSVKTASLANNGTQVINWHASADAPWITLKPASGRLQPSQSISIAINASPPAAGVTDATISITGDDGSKQTLQYSTDGG